MSQIIYGWFDQADQSSPTYDPPYDAPCPYCGHQIVLGDVRTHSLMAVSGYARRSYFYRTHRSCDDRRGPVDMDSFILALIERGGD